MMNIFDNEYQKKIQDFLDFDLRGIKKVEDKISINKQIEQAEEMLIIAVANEQYLEAAEIRDLLIELKNA